MRQTFALSLSLSIFLIWSLLDSSADVLPSPPAPDVRIIGPTARTHLGGSGSPGDASIANHSTALVLADVNGDGLMDVIVGAPDAGDRAGAVYVVLGRRSWPSQIDLATQADITIVGAAGDRLGFALAAGDINGDGKTDLVVGAPGNETVYVFAGFLNGGVIDLAGGSGASLIIRGLSVGPSFGFALAVGDVNHDGFEDLAVGAPDHSGAAVLVLGHQSLASGAQLIDLSGVAPDFIVRGQADGDALGAAVAIGDVNGDGFGDLIVGAPGATRPPRSQDGVTPAQNTGAAFGFFGPLTGSLSSSASPFVFYGYSAGDRTGEALAVGDLTGDGIAELAIGAPGSSAMWNDPVSAASYYNGNEGGVAYVLTGPTAAKRYDAVLGEWATADLEGRSHVGFALRVGRYDVQGAPAIIPDLLLGSGQHAGSAEALWGGPGLLGTRTRPRQGPSPGPESTFFDDNTLTLTDANAGFSLAAGDINGDGAGDMVVSAPFFDAPNRAGAGLVDIWFGVKPAGPPAPSVSSIRPNSASSAGGTVVTIFGMFFDDHATVTIGGVQATSVSVGSPTVLNATTGPHVAGVVDVVVANPDGQKGSLSGGFTYSGPPPPVILAAAIQGKNLVVTGQYFDAGSVLLLNSTDQRTIDVDGSTLIGKKVAKQIPQGQTVTLQVRNSSGISSAVFPFAR